MAPKIRQNHRRPALPRPRRFRPAPWPRDRRAAVAGSAAPDRRQDASRPAETETGTSYGTTAPRHHARRRPPAGPANAPPAETETETAHKLRQPAEDQTGTPSPRSVILETVAATIGTSAARRPAAERTPPKLRQHGRRPPNARRRRRPAPGPRRDDPRRVDRRRVDRRRLPEIGTSYGRRPRRDGNHAHIAPIQYYQLSPIFFVDFAMLILLANISPIWYNTDSQRYQNRTEPAPERRRKGE